MTTGRRTAPLGRQDLAYLGLLALSALLFLAARWPAPRDLDVRYPPMVPAWSLLLGIAPLIALIALLARRAGVPAVRWLMAMVSSTCAVGLVLPWVKRHLLAGLYALAHGSDFGPDPRMLLGAVVVALLVAWAAALAVCAAHWRVRWDAALALSPLLVVPAASLAALIMTRQCALDCRFAPDRLFELQLVGAWLVSCATVVGALIGAPRACPEPRPMPDPLP